MCVLSFPPKNDKMPQTNRRKCSRHGHSQITGSAVLVCAGMHELVCEPKGLVGWVGGNDWIQWEEETKAK